MSDSKEVRKGKDILFADDVKRRVKPLSLNALRDFVKIFEKIGETEDAKQMTDSDIEYMLDASTIIVRKTDPVLAADREVLGDAVDLETFQEMMEVAMGAASPEE